MKNNERTTEQRYTIVKVASVRRRAGEWALFDSTIQSTVPGTRSDTKREVKEAAAELGIAV